MSCTHRAPAPRHTPRQSSKARLCCYISRDQVNSDSRHEDIQQGQPFWLRLTLTERLYPALIICGAHSQRRYDYSAMCLFTIQVHASFYCSCLTCTTAVAVLFTCHRKLTGVARPEEWHTANHCCRFCIPRSAMPRDDSCHVITNRNTQRCCPNFSRSRSPLPQLLRLRSPLPSRGQPQQSEQLDQQSGWLWFAARDSVMDVAWQAARAADTYAASMAREEEQSEAPAYVVLRGYPPSTLLCCTFPSQMHTSDLGALRTAGARTSAAHELHTIGFPAMAWACTRFYITSADVRMPPVKHAQPETPSARHAYRARGCKLPAARIVCALHRWQPTFSQRPTQGGLPRKPPSRASHLPGSPAFLPTQTAEHCGQQHFDLRAVLITHACCLHVAAWRYSHLHQSHWMLRSGTTQGSPNMEGLTCLQHKPCCHMTSGTVL